MKQKNIKIKKGLNIPIKGIPENTIHKTNDITKVALIASDYVGIKPRMHIKVGDKVKIGQVLFQDKKNEKVLYTSPGGGEILEINRGEKRALISVVIKIDSKEQSINFKSYSKENLLNEKPENLIKELLKSGLWTSIRQRPFNKVADPNNIPNSIFVTAIDTDPFAPFMKIIINNNIEAFNTGLRVLSKIIKKNIFVCYSQKDKINFTEKSIEKVKYQSFSGKHPAGLVGTHIHFLDPVNKDNHIWHIGAQDLIALGHFINTGKIYIDKICSFAGYGVKKPRLIKTRIGANTDEITEGSLNEGQNRVISGSVLSGKIADGFQSYLGRYHQIISVINEDRKQALLGWLSPGINNFSFKRTVLSKFLLNKKFKIGTSLNGDIRPIVPIGSYEDVMPIDIMSTILLKAIAISDLEESEKLGCLELVEEDLALCTFVCHSKIDHMSSLRRVLDLIEKEG